MRISKKSPDARESIPVFAALADETRLSLLSKLTAGEPLSIARLSAGSDITRQAVTKHLRVLEDAKLISSHRTGRETRFSLCTDTLSHATRTLQSISDQWDQALARLKAFVDS